METLDVTQIEPKFKHSTIFQRFDALNGGESFIIHNDHDPKPLYYQMVAERGQTFDWEYILEGPQFWEVKISKLNTGEKQTTIGELVAADYRKAAVFSKFGLDFCCGGKKSLKDACHEKGIDEKVVESALTEVEGQVTNTQHNFNSWELDFLADYIINVHHKYVKENVSMLYEYSDKVANRHGNNHPEVIKIAEFYEKIAIELKSHLEKEEKMLFPYIKQLVATKNENGKIVSSAFGNIENPINMMLSEHEIVGEYMEEIHQLSNNYTSPADACSSYQVLYSKLAEFEKDLHQHIHLENNILFPKAIKLEKELLS